VIVITGKLGATKTGEVTVWAMVVRFAAKALLPPPAKWEGLSDVELRYRQRYVDLWANPDVMRVLKLRMQIVDEVRQYMRGQGYMEVETPMMQVMHGGAAARPFVTKHNALGMDLYMRIAPELFLKRLLVGGFTKVFELNRNFRNEGISPRHNPEFTMLEAYEAFGSFETMADMVEGMICHLAEKLFGGLKIVHRARKSTTENTEGTERVINLQRPWRRVRMVELVREAVGWDFKKERASAKDVRNILDAMQMRNVRVLANQFKAANPRLAERLLQLTTIQQFEAEKQSIRDLVITEHKEIQGRIKDAQSNLNATTDAELSRLNASLAALSALQADYLRLIDKKNTEDRESAFLYKFTSLSPAEQLVEVYEKLIEPTLIDPTFVTHVPSVIIPLARKNKDDPFFADVYELAINGQEISPGYTELNDPDIQAENFRHQVGDKEEQQKADEDFLMALRYGMPPAGGMGLGIDRLVMMLTGAESIRDVILFPLMKPQE
jgi:lysyl-tRNA synthetase class 2